jgi:hypothetical protein
MANTITLDPAATTFHNPYFEEFMAVMRDGYRVNAYKMRDVLAIKYAWAIPDETVIRKIADSGPLVEIGAGTGYWAKLLSEAGADIVAYDIALQPGFDDFAQTNTGSHFNVLPGGANNMSAHGDRTLFLCCPPYTSPMAQESLALHATAGGTRLVYVGESRGGCTADDAFFDLLDREYKHFELYSIPRWSGTHDYAWFYERR